MESIAKAKFLRGSPQKARLVIDLIRGRNVAQALAILQFTNKRAAEPIEKCVRSAIANANNLAEQQNVAIDPDGLWVKACFVDQGPSKNRRRVRPAPQGRAYREKRYYCHITVMLTSEKPVNAKGVQKKTAKPGQPASKRTATVSTAAPVTTIQDDAAVTNPAVVENVVETPLDAVAATPSTITVEPIAEQTTTATTTEPIVEQTAAETTAATETAATTEAAISETATTETAAASENQIAEDTVAAADAVAPMAEETEPAADNADNKEQQS